MDPSSIITNVLGQLGNLAVSKARELMSVRDQVMAWKPELELIQGKLEDLEFKPDKGKEAEAWMSLLREVASKMSQVIDAYNSEIENTKPKGFRKLKFWEKPLQLNALSADITSIRQSLETLHRYDLNNMMNRRPHNPAEVDDPDIVGFDSAKCQIISHLLDESISRRTVLSIVGIGGLGKTTLAKKVYNSSDLKGHFKCCAWQDISQTFDQCNILRKILYSIKPEMENIKPPLDDTYLASEIKRCLSNKRYLIILDDVWSKDLWDGLKEAFPDSENGSRVIITTRQLDIARAADRNTKVCKLGFLTEDESTALLFRTALQRPDIQLQNYPLDLKDIAQKLIKRCGGLPLALIVLGGILSTAEYDTPAAWNRVYETMDWHDGDGQKCMKTLEKSYEALPNDHLKQCFRSLGDFPEDYDISAKLITRLWVAEELIPKPGVGTLEDQAEKYLQELVKRCLVQVTKISTDGYCRSFRVHDLLREIAIRKTREEKLPPYRVVQQYGSLRNDDDLESRNTHSLLCFGVDMSDFNFQGFEDLRVLLFEDVNWRNIYMSALRDWLEGLVHLRYLGFRDCRYVKKFLWNVSFGRLKCLETFECTSTEVILNPSLWGIPTLRHVFGWRICIESNEDSPLNWSCLKNLQTFKKAWLRPSQIPTVECNLNLRALKIKILDYEDETCAVEEAWQRLETLLSRAGYLVSLSLSADELSFLDVSRNFGLPCYEKIQSLSLRRIWTSVPSVEMFPKYLTKLRLAFSEIEEDPMSILEKLQSLRILCLLNNSYMGTKMVCSAGGFPSLQKLLLVELYELREWKIEERAMPCLGHLKISGCSRLRQLPELQNVSSLRELEVYGASDELCEMLETEDQYKIEHILSVYVVKNGNVIIQKVPHVR